MFSKPVKSQIEYIKLQTLNHSKWIYPVWISWKLLPISQYLPTQKRASSSEKHLSCFWNRFQKIKNFYDIWDFKNTFAKNMKNTKSLKWNFTFVFPKTIPCNHLLFLSLFDDMKILSQIYRCSSTRIDLPIYEPATTFECRFIASSFIHVKKSS